ncbi:UDP-2,4-diacetamido-2,4,6-trideoxy-beta-L-altropyranose hydrolase [Halarcobacter sp.]|uniref:UDP-2,4-diacetamido-2,4, 6-trideoxy-beta-L-altropyranose hydrolase n=1 Tax=Halarcobacter sp. TaxID=2321133 RepID=UPI0029F4F2C5|nr:UDP-2,4-diacetamido-2,4,6-trideoxy-beta-L-altropyranose hydrolase [Halarcobacter sp.]
MKKILFRCDSSSTIGLGHVKRCLVLAKRLKAQNKQLQIIFSSLDLKGNINKEILKNGFMVYILKDNKTKSLNDLIKNLEVDFLIIDSYDIYEDFEKKIKTKNKNLKILSFDDTLNFHCSDFILNHGIQADKKNYKKLVSKNCKIWCGSKYTLLRDEFFNKYKKKPEKKSIAIILGGNDVLNLSSKISKYLLKIDNKYKISIITSNVNIHLEELKKNLNVKVLVDIDNIAEVLSSKEFVISASGGTLFEVLALKKKFINIEVANNQKVVTDFLKQKNIKTTIKADELSLEKLKEKIEYIEKTDIYKKIDLKFSKDRLIKKILKELE